LINLHAGEAQPAAHIVLHHRPRDGDTTKTQRDGDDDAAFFGTSKAFFGTSKAFFGTSKAFFWRW
jgi:hypothetical protein